MHTAKYPTASKRLRYLVPIVITVIAGLCSRIYGVYLPKLLAEYMGDILWASMAYFGICFLWGSIRIRRAALYALVFSYCVEISQLCQAGWINALRRTFIGAMVLGHGFLWSDIVCYTIGVLFAAFIDMALIRKAAG